MGSFACLAASPRAEITPLSLHPIHCPALTTLHNPDHADMKSSFGDGGEILEISKRKHPDTDSKQTEQPRGRGDCNPHQRDGLLDAEFVVLPAIRTLQNT